MCQVNNDTLHTVQYNIVYIQYTVKMECQQTHMCSILTKGSTCRNIPKT